LAQKACRDGYSVLYTRAQSLFRDLAMARADGSLRSLLGPLSRIDVLIIDDWAMAPLSEPERRDFWEICEDRYQVRSTILSSQLPVSRWHEQIGEPNTTCNPSFGSGDLAEIERLLWMALAPDQLAVAAAALEQLEEEARLLERQWALKRERARYEAERARRQYVAVEPENRLVARSLECAWEDKLRQQEKVEQDYERWRREQPAALTEADRQEILTIAEDLPRVWQAPTTTAADRKQLVRFILKEVALHQKREAGLLRMRISWQTGAITEHWMRRRVQDYRQYANLDRLEQRLRELNAQQKMDAEIAEILNAEGYARPKGDYSRAQISIFCASAGKFRA
jgi:hypothetical protein